MSSFTFTSPDGKNYTIEGPEGATKEQAFDILQSQLKSTPSAPSASQSAGMTPEQVQAHLKKTAIGMGRAENPKLSMIMDVVGGMSNSMRGGLNLIKEGLGEKVFPTGAVDKKSTTYGLSTLADPIPWLIGGGVGKVLPYAPVLGGGASKAINAIGRNVAGGATAGGAIGLLGDDSTVSGGILAGGIGGAAAPVVIGGLSKLGSTVGNVVQPLFGKKGVEKTAGRTLNQLLKNESDDIIPLLAAAKPGENAAQAGIAAQSPRLAALQKFSDSIRDKQAHDALMAQEIARATQMEQASGLKTLGEAKIDLISKAIPIKESAFDLIRRAQQGTGKLAGVKAGAIEGNEIARNAGTGNYPFTPGTEAGKKVSNAINNAANAHQQGDVQALAKYTKDLADETFTKFKGEFAPLNADAVTGSIREILDRPNVYASADARKALKMFGSELNAITRNGVIDPEAMATLRTQGINGVIDRLYAGRDLSAAKAGTASVLKELKPVIDEAMTKASGGNPAWGKYLSEFESGMRKIDEMSVMKGLGRKLNTKFERNLTAPEAMETPTSFISELNRVKTQLGDTNKPLYDSLTPDKKMIVDDIERQLSRDIKNTELAAKGTTAVARELRRDEIPQISGPGLIDRKLSVYNWTMRMLSGKGGQLTDDMIAELTHNPPLMAKVMRAASTSKEAKQQLNKSIIEKMRVPIGVAGSEK